MYKILAVIFLISILLFGEDIKPCRLDCNFTNLKVKNICLLANTKLENEDFDLENVDKNVDKRLLKMFMEKALRCGYNKFVGVK